MTVRLEPTEGSTVGGHTVKIVGTHLEDASAVHFGAATASEVQRNLATEITVKTPAHEAEAVDVTVTTPGGTSAPSAADRFTYVTPPEPTVTALSPSEGSIAGGTTVKVTGTNLEGASAVDSATSAGGEVHVLSATELKVKSPAHAAGTVDVTVTDARRDERDLGRRSLHLRAPRRPNPPPGSPAPPSHQLRVEPRPPRPSGTSGPRARSNNSNFNVLSEQVNGRTAPSSSRVAVFNRGTLHWTAHLSRSGCPSATARARRLPLHERRLRRRHEGGQRREDPLLHDLARPGGRQGACSSARNRGTLVS